MPSNLNPDRPHNQHINYWGNQRLLPDSITIEDLKKKFSSLHTLAVNLFDKWNEGVVKILQAMKLDDPYYRRIFHLIELLKYHTADRFHAIRELNDILSVALGKVGPAAVEAVPALIDDLRDPKVSTI